MLDKAEKVTATEANRNFSQLFRRAKEGETIIITDRGQDAAMLSPAPRKSEVELAAEAAAREESRQKLFARLRSQPVLNLGKFSRDEIYDEVVGIGTTNASGDGHKRNPVRRGLRRSEADETR